MITEQTLLVQSRYLQKKTLNAADQHKMCLKLLQSLNYAHFSPGTCKISRNKSGENSLRRGTGTLISNSWIGKKYAQEKRNSTLVPGSFN